MMKYILLFNLLLLFSDFYAQRMVLIEQFTNASCGSCANYTPPLMQFADENPTNVITIAFHGPYPGLDSMYYESKDDNDSRINYYNILSVPSAVVNGNYYKGSSFNLLNNLDTISSLFSLESNYEIDFEDILIRNTTITGNINISAVYSRITENINLQIAIVEKLVLKSSYASSPGSNSETKYNYVVRKLLPTENGTAIEFIDDEASVSFEWNISNFKNPEQLRIVAFIQDNASNEIYQSNYYDIATSIQYIHKNELQLFPNPTNNVINVSINQKLHSTYLSIFDVQGKLIENINIKNFSGVYTHSIKELKPGLYIIQLENMIYRFIKY